MTTINCDIRDSLGQPLAGSIRITLSKPVSTADNVTDMLTVPAVVPLVAGQVSFDLEPTTDDRVSYLFEVLDSDGGVVRLFSAQVPDSGPPVSFATLAAQSGITAEGYDGNLNAVVRRLYSDPVFWDRARETLAPYRGEYVSTTFYRRGDVVQYQGSAWVYVAAIATAASIPSELPTSFWRLWARKGDPGAGTQGATDPYDSANWTANTEAVSKGSLVTIIDSLASKTELSTKVSATDALLTNPRRVDTLQSNAVSTQITSAAWVRARIDEIKGQLLPVGTHIHWMFPAAPANWFHLDGYLFLDATYPALAALFGKRHNIGGDPSDRTRLPDWRGVGLIGSDYSPLQGNRNYTTFADRNSLGKVIGTNDQTLNESQLPPIGIQLKQGLGAGGSVAGVTTSGTFTSSQNNGQFTVPFGAGLPHSIVQASGVGHWIMYAGLPQT